MRPDAAKRPETGKIEANEQGFQRANGSLNKKKQRKNGNRKKTCSTGVVFQRPVKEADEDVWASDEEILFLCISCEQIATLSYEEHKIVTRYVEHKVHELCILNLPKLRPVEKIISDTTRTAPSRCRFPWGDTVAILVYNQILKYLSRGN